MINQLFLQSRSCVRQAPRRISKIVVVMLSLCSACSDPASPPPPILAADPFWGVTIDNVRRAIMSTESPYDTLRLQTSVRLASGALLPGAGRPIFDVSDSTLTVTADGLVTAHETTSNSYVTATYYDSATHVTRADTVIIGVTNEVAPPMLRTFTLREANDSPTYPIDVGTSLVATGTGDGGVTLTPELKIEYRSRDVESASVDRNNGLVRGVVPGRPVMFVASTTYYGVTKVDSVQLIADYPAVGVTFLVPLADSTGPGMPRGFDPAQILIRTGGFVVFNAAMWIADVTIPGPPDDIVFDDPSAAEETDIVAYPYAAPTGTGNISVMQVPALLEDYSGFAKCFAFEAHCWESRRFPRAGVYHFHSTRSGAHGTITVKSITDPR